MFGKRLNILNVGGIKIGVDISWLFIAILITVSLALGYFPYYSPHQSQEAYWIMGFIGMLGLFICVILHELGHSLVALHYKIPVPQITLFLFGGVAEIKKEPDSAKVEFLMAIAGPLVSVVLAALMYVLTVLGMHYHWPFYVTGITTYLAVINLILVIFNLLPAFPLDGGRVFRSILWGLKKDIKWATRVATQIGKIFGLILILIGIFLFIRGLFFSGIWIAIIGIFLRQAAASSLMQLYLNEGLREEKVTKFMKTTLITVSPDITVDDFVEKFVYQSHHYMYPVMEQGRPLGIIILNSIKSVPKSEWGSTSVVKFMIPFDQLKTVTPNTNAMKALEIMQENDIPSLLVMEDNKLVGIVTESDLYRKIALKLELEK